MRIQLTRMRKEKTIQYKDFEGAVKDVVRDVDSTSRTVKIAIASFGEQNLDRDRDIILSTAVTKTIRERGPLGTKEIWHMCDHWYDLAHGLSKFKELFVEGEYLIGVSPIAKTPMGNIAMEHYEAGNINQHSIGFTVVNEEPQKNGTNIIKELILWEGSAVLWGANPNTPVLSVQKSLNKDRAKSMLSTVTKTLKSGSFDDDTFYLLELQFKQLQQYINDLEEKATAPAPTTQPVEQSYDYSALAASIKSITDIVKI